MASMYGGLLGGINQTNKTLTSILTISDGFTTLSGGNISGVQNISTSNLSISGDLSAPELITSNIQTINGFLQIGNQNDDIQIIGNNIRFLGNVIGYDSANVIIVDKAIDLNASGFGNATLDGAGINVLGDGNIVVSSLLTNNVGDWIFTSPNNNKVVIGNLEVANLSVTNPIVYENFQASNITATNKFFSPERIITDRSVYRSSAISHLQVGSIQSTGLIQSVGSIINKNDFDLSTLSLLSQQENGYILFGNIMIQWGTIADLGTQIATFNPVFSQTPWNAQITRQGVTTGGSTATGAARIISMSTSQMLVDSATGSADKTGIYWIAIGLI